MNSNNSNYSDIEKSIIVNMNYNINAIQVSPIQIVPIPNGSANPNNIRFTSNTLINSCDDAAKSNYQSCYIFDKADINNIYPHTGLYRASASSIYDSTYDAYNAFNQGSNSGWRSKSVNTKALATSIYNISSDNTTTYNSAYGNVHYGNSYYNWSDPNPTITKVTNPTITTTDTAITLNHSTDVKTTINKDKKTRKANYGRTNIAGEWLQIQLPLDTPIYLFRYGITVPPPTSSLYPSDDKTVSDYINNTGSNSDTMYKPSYKVTTPKVKWTSYFPKAFTVVASKDGVEWIYVDQQAFTDPPDLPKSTYTTTTTDPNFVIPGNNYCNGDTYQGCLNANGKSWCNDNCKSQSGSYYPSSQYFVSPSITTNKGYEMDPSNNTVYFEVNAIDHYSYYRIIITEMFPGNTFAQIYQWSLYAFVDNVTPNKLSLNEASYKLPYEAFGGFSENFVRKIGEKNNKENSPEYVTGMNPSFSWDSFRTDVNPDLLNEYQNQKTMISKAKQTTNPLTNLGSYTIENFDNHGFVQHTYSDAILTSNNNVAPMISIYNDYLSKQQQVNQNYFDLSQNIQNFNAQYSKMINDKNDKYDLSGNNFNKAPTVTDGRISDNKEIIMQQNSMYIISTITIATLVLALILVSK
jgi:hypothetical protein